MAYPPYAPALPVLPGPQAGSPTGCGLAPPQNTSMASHPPMATYLHKDGRVPLQAAPRKRLMVKHPPTGGRAPPQAAPRKTSNTPPHGTSNLARLRWYALSLATPHATPYLVCILKLRSSSITSNPTSSRQTTLPWYDLAL